MKLRNIAEYSQLTGGKAVELAASYADNPGEFKYTTPLLHYKDCNFSFAGLKNAVERHVEKIEKELGKTPYSQHMLQHLIETTLAGHLRTERKRGKRKLLSHVLVYIKFTSVLRMSYTVQTSDF